LISVKADSENVAQTLTSLVERHVILYLDTLSSEAGFSQRSASSGGFRAGGHELQGLSRWYVAQTQPRKELFAIEHLTRQGYVTFFPRFRFSQTRRQRRDTVLKPVFPGYLFVAFDASSPGWTSINSTRGVRRLISSGEGRPQPVPVTAMELIRRRCRGQIMLELLDDLQPGDLVQVNTGPLANRVARVERLAEGDRVALLFEIMGTEQIIMLDQGSIGPVTASAAPAC